jgi:hypothetical protein
MSKKRSYDEMSAQIPTTLPPPRAFKPSDMITLLVGPDEQAMVVHEDCLSRDSRFFRAALKKEWRKGRIIELPEETPFHMGYYIEHLDGFDLPTRKLATGPPNQDCEQFPYELLATLYVLGERMLDSEYRNKIIHEFFRLVDFNHFDDNVDSWPGAGPVNIIYKGTTAESPARRMMVDFAVTHSYVDGLERYAAMNHAFLFDFSKCLLQRVEDQEDIRDFRGYPLEAEDYLVADR